jgi:hypothetical protein
MDINGIYIYGIVTSFCYGNHGILYIHWLMDVNGCIVGIGSEYSFIVLV